MKTQNPTQTLYNYWVDREKAAKRLPNWLTDSLPPEAAWSAAFVALCPTVTGLYLLGQIDEKLSANLFWVTIAVAAFALLSAEAIFLFYQWDPKQGRTRWANEDTLKRFMKYFFFLLLSGLVTYVSNKIDNPFAHLLFSTISIIFSAVVGYAFQQKVFPKQYILCAEPTDDKQILHIPGGPIIILDKYSGVLSIKHPNQSRKHVLALPLKVATAPQNFKTSISSLKAGQPLQPPGPAGELVLSDITVHINLKRLYNSVDDSTSIKLREIRPFLYSSLQHSEYKRRKPAKSIALIFDKNSYIPINGENCLAYCSFFFFDGTFPIPLKYSS